MDKKDVLLVVAGGLRIGDSFRFGNKLLNLCQEYGAIDILCTRYTFGVFEFFHRATDINLRKLFVVAGAEPQPGNWEAVINFKTYWGDILRVDNVRLLQSIKKDIAPGPFQGKVKDIEFSTLPVPPYIVVHADSVSKWKRVSSLFEVNYPYPVVIVGFLNEKVVKGTVWDFRGAPWTVVMSLLQHCSFWVSIDSAVFNAAVFIKKHGICVHFQEDLYGVENCQLGVDLINPSVKDLQDEIDNFKLITFPIEIVKG